jgi:hypothetical protein
MLYVFRLEDSSYTWRGERQTFTVTAAEFQELAESLQVGNGTRVSMA